ncbi:MAG: hypothetical protein NWE95_07220 [Candidatus Bathyarchaeota archaeon]|nr:hypothetical protein [Candidatus Bathyarchaeota archaeon]
MIQAAIAYKMSKIKEAYLELKKEKAGNFPCDTGAITYYFSAIFPLLSKRPRTKYSPPLGLVMTPHS